MKQDLKTAGVAENTIKGVRLPQLATAGDTEFIGESFRNSKWDASNTKQDCRHYLNEIIFRAKYNSFTEIQKYKFCTEVDKRNYKCSISLLCVSA